MSYIVLGMHKSGTTLLARALHAAGVPMIDHAEKTHDYDKGSKHERRSISDLNKTLLSAHKVNSLDLPAPRNSIRISNDDRERMRRVVHELNAANDSWGVKDPRFCLTYEYWLPMLPEHMIVAVYRHPVEVAKHYLVRASAKEKETPQQERDVLQKAQQRWIEHNARLLRILRRSTHPWVLLSYERLMTSDAEWERFGQTLGLPMPDVREADKYRNRREWDANYMRAMFQTIWRMGRPAEWLYYRLERLRHRSGATFLDQRMGS